MHFLCRRKLFSFVYFRWHLWYIFLDFRSVTTLSFVFFRCKYFFVANEVDFLNLILLCVFCVVVNHRRLFSLIFKFLLSNRPILMTVLNFSLKLIEKFFFTQLFFRPVHRFCIWHRFRLNSIAFSSTNFQAMTEWFLIFAVSVFFCHAMSFGIFVFSAYGA